MQQKPSAELIKNEKLKIILSFSLGHFRTKVLLSLSPWAKSALSPPSSSSLPRPILFIKPAHPPSLSPLGRLGPGPHLLARAWPSRPGRRRRRLPPTAACSSLPAELKRRRHADLNRIPKIGSSPSPHQFPCVFPS